MTTTCDQTLLDEVFADFLLARDHEPALTAAQFAARLPGSLRQAFHDEVKALDRCAAPRGGMPSMVAGGYRLGACLGQGASGRVHRAEQLALGRTVAIKLLHEGAAGDAQAVPRLHREARILAGLQHAAIVAVFDVVAIDGRPALVQQLAPGRSLRTLLAASGDARHEAHAVARAVLGDTRAVIALFARLADALAHAHERGVVHRDVKPANVVVGDDGMPMLVDFGLASRCGAGPADDADGAHTAVGDVIGTPLYMAPEQLAGRRALPAADVWALGSMLQECLTGHAAAGPDAVLPSRVPARLRTLIRACRRQAPATRPTAATLAARLRGMLRRTPRGAVLGADHAWRRHSAASA